MERLSKILAFSLDQQQTSARADLAALLLRFGVLREISWRRSGLTEVSAGLWGDVDASGSFGCLLARCPDMHDSQERRGNYDQSQQTDQIRGQRVAHGVRRMPERGEHPEEEASGEPGERA